jgi:5-methylcytosine-specific restriction enzyme subunit McrC
MSKDKTFVILEHHWIYAVSGCEPEQPLGHLGLPQAVFQEIETFVLQNGDEASRFLIPSYHKQFGKTLKAQQFVGVIETQSGYVIEILPKIAKQDNEVEVRKTFLKMLRTLRDSPFKYMDQAALQSCEMHLLEIYISMFCEELAVLVQRGIKSDYISRSENANALKGRLKLSEHLRLNSVHKERFFVEFDEYECNRIENRILRTAIQFLLKKSRSDRNQKRLREFLFVFDDITPIQDVKTAFAQVKINRQMQDYQNLLRWSRMFLDNKSFSSFKGHSVAFALLFDMNRVFENYVAHCLRRAHPDWHIETQVSEKYLLESPREFLMKPDLRVEPKTSTATANTDLDSPCAGERWIGDTKWKLLQPDDRHLGISQGDLYQMYAYGHKYKTPHIKIIYPWFEGLCKLPHRQRIFEHHFKTEDQETCDFVLEICGFDCEAGKLVALETKS